jgi:hypothetical protein
MVCLSRSPPHGTLIQHPHVHQARHRYSNVFLLEHVALFAARAPRTSWLVCGRACAHGFDLRCAKDVTSAAHWAVSRPQLSNNTPKHTCTITQQLHPSLEAQYYSSHSFLEVNPHTVFQQLTHAHGRPLLPTPLRIRHLQDCDSETTHDPKASSSHLHIQP